MKYFTTLVTVSVLCIMIFGSSLVCSADDVTDMIQEGLKNYKDGKYSEAVENLDYAAQLIRQKKGSTLENFFPEPLAGWTAEKSKSDAMSGAMFGGGVSAERSYSKNQSSIEIQIMADSPLLQGMMMMMTNPMFASSDGAKLEKIKGQKAMVKYDPTDKSGEINIVVANKYLVTISGSDTSRQDMITYASKIDYAKLAVLE